MADRAACGRSALDGGSQRSALMIRGFTRRSARTGPRHDASAEPPHPLGASPSHLADRASSVQLVALALGMTAVAVAGVVAVTAAHATGVAVVCLVLLGAGSLLALRWASSWRALRRRSADDAAELLDIIDEIGAGVSVRDIDGRYLLVQSRAVLAS
jgi:hypothetical protein